MNMLAAEREDCSHPPLSNPGQQLLCPDAALSTAGPDTGQAGLLCSGSPSVCWAVTGTSQPSAELPHGLRASRKVSSNRWSLSGAQLGLDPDRGQGSRQQGTEAATKTGMASGGPS